MTWLTQRTVFQIFLHLLRCFMKKNLSENEEFTGLFNLPGEGFVAQIRVGSNTQLYDRQGLQFLILQRKQEGKSVTALEDALTKMNSLGDTLRLHGA